VAAALKDVRDALGVRTVVAHTRCWAAAYGDHAASLAPALKSGVALATTRFRFGDGFTLENYLDTLALPDEADGETLAAKLRKVSPGAALVPSKKVTEKKVTTIGLGDAFVGGFLAKLSESGIRYARR
jgi:ADP-dependent phosphofructokinase/glucokinase